jgi:hypothetical protein
MIKVLQFPVIGPGYLRFRVRLVLSTAALMASFQAHAGFEVTLLRDSPGWAIAWEARMRDAKGFDPLPSFELQQSLDLKTWTTVGSPLRGTSTAAQELLRARLPVDAKSAGAWPTPSKPMPMSRPLEEALITKWARVRIMPRSPEVTPTKRVGIQFRRRSSGQSTGQRGFCLG